MMNEINGGAAVVAALADNDVRVAFGIPGSHNLEIYRHLADSGIRHISPRHEQGAGYAADGYYRVTGRPGVAITTSGPGLTNICTAAGAAYADSIPLLIISPGVPRGLERADIGWLHEVKDQQGHMDRLVDRSVRVASAEEAYQAVAEAFARWRAGRPRPVHVEIPVDVLDQPWSGTRPASAPHAPPVLDTGVLTAAANALNAAKSPLLVVGGGARSAAKEIARLVEAFDLTVVSTVNGKGVLPERHPLSLGASLRLPSAWQQIEQADVLLVVGSELGDSDLWGHRLAPLGTVIRADIDVRQAHKNVPADIVIIGDAAAVADRLAGLADRDAPRGGAAGRAVKVREQLRAEAERDGRKWRKVNEILAAELPADAIIAGDSAQVSYFGTVHFWPADRPGQFLYPTGYATLGYGLPAAIGAKAGAPERDVVVLVGDGGFMFSAQELATAAAERMNLPVIVMNNRGYAEIRAEMTARAIKPTAVDLTVVDFAALGRACGGFGLQLDDLARLPEALHRARGADRPTVIQIDVGGD
jgi:thiamine pyrophosphate-dependent acetolactate synthase large subunit-like protein